MNRQPVTASKSIRTAAAAVALGLTGLVLVSVDRLAQQRTVSSYAQIVQLERVVVTGQRLAGGSATRQVANAADHCDTSARSTATKTC